MVQMKKPLKSNLNETVLFSLCGMSSVVLCQAFEEDFNKTFKLEALNSICTYFCVNQQVRQTCLALLNEDPRNVIMEPYSVTLIGDSNENICPFDLLRELLMIFVSKGFYGSRVRVFLRHFAFGLHLGFDELILLENELILMINNDNCADQSETVSRNKKRRNRRAMMIGAAAISGGVLIGVTGGLAAPFIAASLGAFGASIAGGVGAVVTGTSVAVGSTVGVAVVGSLFGGAGAGLTGYKMNKRVGEISEFTINSLSTNKQLTLAIAISGYLNNGTSDFHTPWSNMNLSGEQYYLIWESEYLIAMGKSMEYLLSYVKSAAISETLKLTAIGAILSAVAWPSVLLSMSSIIDNPWSVCISRAELAGRTLADYLISADYGKRPVTLIGFSLGARVVFYCLQELASRTCKEVEDIIEDVYLIGAPITTNVQYWTRLQHVVASRIVNAYCKSDWMLKFLYRTTIASTSIAGLEPIQWDNKRMCNMDISHVVTGHSDYLSKMPEIMHFMGLRTNAIIPSDISSNFPMILPSSDLSTLSTDVTNNVIIVSVDNLDSESGNNV